MRTRRILSLLWAGFLFACGCVYQKPIVLPRVQTDSPAARLPLSLAVEIPAHPRLFFECLSPCCAAYLPFELPVEQETARALAQRLSLAGFQSVLQQPGETAASDYIARAEIFPQFTNEQNCKIKPRFYKLSSYEPFYAVLRITIRHRLSQEITAQYEERVFIRPDYPFSARMLSTLAPYTLGVFSPMQMQAMGQTLSAQIQEALAQLLDKIVGHIQEDKLLFTAEFSALQEEELSAAGRYRHLLQSVVSIRNPSNQQSGSAFFITANGYLVTAAHLVQETDWVEYTSLFEPDSPSRRAQVISRNTARDVALLKAAVQGARALSLEKQNPHRFKGEKVISLGSGPTPVTQGVLSGVSRINGTRYLLADSTFVAPHAGGPMVLGENGLVLGVNTGVIQPGLTQAVSLFEIEKLFPQIIKEIEP